MAEETATLTPMPKISASQIEFAERNLTSAINEASAVSNALKDPLRKQVNKAIRDMNKTLDMIQRIKNAPENN